MVQVGVFAGRVEAVIRCVDPPIRQTPLPEFETRSLENRPQSCQSGSHDDPHPQLRNIQGACDPLANDLLIIREHILQLHMLPSKPIKILRLFLLL